MEGGDGQLLDWLSALDVPRLVLATKIDDVPRSKRVATLAALGRAYGVGGDDLIGFSSKEKIGVEEAQRAIDRAARG